LHERRGVLSEEEFGRVVVKLDIHLTEGGWARGGNTQGAVSEIVWKGR